LSDAPSGAGVRLMSAAPRTILVVDDEAPLRRVLERSLARQGLRVIGAGSAETAYELLATVQPDALLLDIHLPTMSGLALYLAIVHRWPAFEGRIAIMTGDAEADEVRTWLERHECVVIRKPFNLRELTDWLTGVFRIDEERARGGAGAGPERRTPTRSKTCGSPATSPRGPSGISPRSWEPGSMRPRSPPS